MGLGATAFVGAGITKRAEPWTLILFFIFGAFCGLVLGIVVGVILTTIGTGWIRILRVLCDKDEGDTHLDDRRPDSRQ